MKVVTSSEMARIEKLAYDSGASERDFMEAAGRGIADYVMGVFGALRGCQRVVLLCGKGNNAGDAYVAGCHLIEEGLPVLAIQVEPLEDCSTLCQEMAERFQKEEGLIIRPEQTGYVSTDLFVDALFGTGFKGELQDPYLPLIEQINSVQGTVIAVDIPSGVNGDTGEIGGAAVFADLTLALGLFKKGHFLGAGKEYVGKLIPVNFGLGSEFVDEAEFTFRAMTADSLPPLPTIRKSRHKYQAGLLSVVAGSPGMPGAAYMTCMAGYRMGAGLVRLLTPQLMPDSPHEIVQQVNMPHVFEQASAIALGPGIGQTAEAMLRVQQTLLVGLPIVIDADGLNLIAFNGLEIPQEAVMTPHRGEMCRLLGISEELEENEMLLRAHEFACQHKITLVLKGGPTWIFHPDHQPVVNTTGNPGMATAGTGDVLTGMIGALMAQGVEPYDAARLGVYLHGAAGDVAADRYGQRSLIASDVINAISQVISRL